MKQIPEPTYNYETDVLVRAYERSMRDLEQVLQTVDFTDVQRAAHVARMAEIQRILRDLDATTEAWALKYVPAAVADGVARTLVALEYAESIEDARKIATMSRINEQLVATAVADLQDDLLAVTQNIERKVRTGLRQATQEAMRANLTAGRNTSYDISRDILAQARAQLGKTLETGIIDAGGRRWKPKTYAKMIARTKLLSAHLESTQNEALSNNALYGIISSHAARDYCRFHEGRIVKLAPDAPGNYPTVAELKATGQIFHPNCRHVVTPVRLPENLPTAVRKKAADQAEAGAKAAPVGRKVSLLKNDA